ncbi:MAG: T9SS type A sorting domain-containing protein [Bacteroidales bacterium]|nr:T9SS type A sorting domain-containing protein [Bacteroidales bacterium]
MATPGGAERLRVTLSPNPASTTLTVTASRWDRYTVTLFDMYGRVLEERPFTGTVCRLDIAAQPAGQYIVKVQSDSAITTVSFVKK